MADSEENDPKKELSTYLEHLRLVHFSLVVVTSTVLYLVISALNSSNELVSELNKLERIAFSLSDVELTNSSLPLKEHAGDSLEPVLLGLNTNVSALIGQPSGLIGAMEALRYNGKATVAGPPLTNASLERERIILEGTVWRVLVPSKIEPEQASSELPLQKWAREPGKGDFQGGLWARLSFEDPKAVPSGLGKGTLTLERTEVAIIDGPPPLYHKNKKHLAQSPSLNILCRWQEVECHLPSLWFTNHFPIISTNWSSVSFKSLFEAKKWAEEQRVAAIKGQSVNLFGMSLKAEHVGWLGPILILVTMLYLGTYVWELRKHVQDVEQLKLKPWVCLMDSPFSMLISIATVAFLPSFAVFLSLRNLLGWGGLAWTTGLITLVFGIFIISIKFLFGK